MKPPVLKIALLTGMIALMTWACRKTEHYPPEPSITYRSFYFRDSVDYLGNKILTGTLTFYFIDGDGDLGMPDIDSLLPGDSSAANLFFSLYYLRNNNIYPADEEEVKTPLSYRIPYIRMTGRDKTMKGEVRVTFFYINFPYDTIRYSFYVVDRAGHQSNTEETPFIILPPN